MKQRGGPIKPLSDYKKFTEAAKAVAYIQDLYDASTAFLQEKFKLYAKDKASYKDIYKAYYPMIRIENDRHGVRVDTRLSYGFLADVGTFSTTITRPDLYKDYLTEQLEFILNNHPYVKIEIGYSDVEMPIHFAFIEGAHLEASLTPDKIKNMRSHFTMPNLAITDDSIVDGVLFKTEGNEIPLSIFPAPRTDYSLHRLRHYTATDPKHFQHFVLFTNYQFYIDQFVEFAEEMMKKGRTPEEVKMRSQYEYFVKPGNEIIRNENLAASPSVKLDQDVRCQMPAFHLVSKDRMGITMVNIGVGPSNARTITDHVAVLRPYAWIMLGHCAGLRASQNLGDYALAHGYVREDNVLDDRLPLHIPLPALSEIQVALETAVGDVTGKRGFELKSLMRTGTVVTTDNRNWELDDHHGLIQKFSQNRAIALDMESATIAANGFRYRVPYGTLLCVSDKPLQGEIKLPGMANKFYKEQVSQHLRIGIRAIDFLKDHMLETLHSRKLRSFYGVAFQ